MPLCCFSRTSEVSADLASFAPSKPTSLGSHSNCRRPMTTTQHQALWGVYYSSRFAQSPAKGIPTGRLSHLRGTEDNFVSVMRHADWTQVVSFPEGIARDAQHQYRTGIVMAGSASRRLLGVPPLTSKILHTIVVPEHLRYAQVASLQNALSNWANVAHSILSLELVNTAVPLSWSQPLSRWPPFQNLCELKVCFADRHVCGAEQTRDLRRVRYHDWDNVLRMVGISYGSNAVVFRELNTAAIFDRHCLLQKRAPQHLPFLLSLHHHDTTVNMSFALNDTHIDGGTFNNVAGNMTQVFNSHVSHARISAGGEREGIRSFRPSTSSIGAIRAERGLRHRNAGEEQEQACGTEEEARLKREQEEEEEARLKHEEEEERSKREEEARLKREEEERLKHEEEEARLKREEEEARLKHGEEEARLKREEEERSKQEQGQVPGGRKRRAEDQLIPEDAGAVRRTGRARLSPEEAKLEREKKLAATVGAGKVKPRLAVLMNISYKYVEKNPAKPKPKTRR
ncbi:hypothetical protein C8R44DRAFT_738889 [Mycena epipterygia]|nr:hypothetical protein C8R44DRAFT_738889 [Mycena epipterygia]